MPSTNGRVSRSLNEGGMAERLEFVRKQVRCDTLRDFWRHLRKDGEYEISYEAVRNYHNDRNPPVEYLNRVAKTFGVSLEWLATGQERPWPGDESLERTSAEAAERARHGDFETALEEVFWHYRKLPALAQAVVLRTCDHLHRDAQVRARLMRKTAPSRSYIGRFVGKALAGPLMNAVAGTVKTGELHPWQMENYAIGICQGLSALVPNPNLGQPSSVPH